MSDFGRLHRDDDRLFAEQRKIAAGYELITEACLGVLSPSERPPLRLVAVDGEIVGPADPKGSEL